MIIPSKDGGWVEVYEQAHNIKWSDMCEKAVDHIKWTRNRPYQVQIGNDFKFRVGLPISVQDVKMDGDIHLVAPLQNDDGDEKVFVSTLYRESTLDNEIAGLFRDDSIVDLAFFHAVKS